MPDSRPALKEAVTKLVSFFRFYGRKSKAALCNNSTNLRLFQMYEALLPSKPGVECKEDFPLWVFGNFRCSDSCISDHWSVIHESASSWIVCPGLRAFIQAPHQPGGDKPARDRSLPAYYIY